MKKFLLAGAILVAAVAAQAEYLNWQVGSTVTIGGNTYTAGTDFDRVLMYANNGSSVNYYGIYEAPGSYSTEVASGWDTADTAYYVELLKYAYAESPQYSSIAKTDATTYSNLSGALSSGALSAQGMTAVWTGVSVVATPEPTSGLLMLMGFAMLGLKRKKEV